MAVAACVAERERPIAGLSGPAGLPDVEIVSPTSNETVILPGEFPVGVAVSSTSGLLESVAVTAVLFATASAVADTAVRFDPTVGDTALTLTLVLEAFPATTPSAQLNLQAEARVSGRSATSAEVPIIAIDCTGRPYEFCP